MANVVRLKANIYRTKAIRKSGMRSIGKKQTITAIRMSILAVRRWQRRRRRRQLAFGSHRHIWKYEIGLTENTNTHNISTRRRWCRSVRSPCATPTYISCILITLFFPRCSLPLTLSFAYTCRAAFLPFCRPMESAAATSQRDRTDPSVEMQNCFQFECYHVSYTIHSHCWRCTNEKLTSYSKQWVPFCLDSLAQYNTNTERKYHLCKSSDEP